MNNFRRSASDASYHSRHAQRTLRRAERVAAHIHETARILDVGCNNGITSRYLLDRGKASHVTGVELHASTVEDELKNDPAFDLIEGNIVDIDIDGRFDAIIYGAVHHHILNFHGLTAAVRTLQSLVAKCDGSLFFETGQIGEGGRWLWQRKMRSYFRTDEEHFFYLLRSIEHQITGFEVIGRFWIHGIRRLYLRIDVGKDDERQEFSHGEDVLPWPAEKNGPFVRTFGSKQQSIHRESDIAAGDSPTCFWTSDSNDGVFIKSHRHHPTAAIAESTIGGQLKNHWAVTPVGVTMDPPAIVFPWLRRARSIADFGSSPESLRRALAAQVLRIFKEAAGTIVRCTNRHLLPGAARSRLIDVVDMNENNLLVMSEGGMDTVYVIDFEQQGTHYAYRNYLHLARILTRLKRHRVKAIVYWVAGVTSGAVWLLRYQWVGLYDRIRSRQPSIASLFVADFRSVAGRALGKFLGLIGFGEP